MEFLTLKNKIAFKTKVFFNNIKIISLLCKALKEVIFLITLQCSVTLIISFQQKPTSHHPPNHLIDLQSCTHRVDPRFLNVVLPCHRAITLVLNCIARRKTPHQRKNIISLSPSSNLRRWPGPGRSIRQSFLRAH